MSTRLLVLMFTLFAGSTLSPILCAQTALPKAPGDQVKQEKWNNIPPRESDYVAKKSAPAPRRNISGVWDAADQRQAFGALEHPALLPQKGGGEQAGRPDETGVLHPLPYTPLGLAALKANKPSGPSMRQVPAVL